MNMDRVNEITSTIKSFGKEKYHKSELLTEMFALQQEIVDLTFNDEHASIANLRIWDVEKHLEQLNQDCGNVADEELQIFKDKSKTLCNLIKAEVSGNRGEAKAFRALQYVQSPNIILKNVEFSDENNRTELDAVVITPAAITIVEVKNTAKNIFIDENGDYYRTGEFLKLDCNIAKKMNIKEELLRKVLTTNGIDNIRIRRVVVFTDKRIEVQNKYSKIKTCFVNQLAYIVDDLKSENFYSNEEMERIENAIKMSVEKETYLFDFDVAQYKYDFATVMTILEDASAKTEEIDYFEKEKIANKNDNAVFDRLKKFFVPDYMRHVGGVTVAVAFVFVSTIAVNARRMKK